MGRHGETVMRIAVMSDSHDNIWNMEKALFLVKEKKAEMIIHCGDFVAPFTLKMLAETGIPVHGVFGNNDGDHYLLTKMAAAPGSNITLHGLMGQVTLDGKTVCFTHYRKIAKGLAAAANCDLACFGHSHVHAVETVGKAVLLNPGEIMGKEGSPGFCLVETDSMEIARVAL